MKKLIALFAVIFAASTTLFAQEGGVNQTPEAVVSSITVQRNTVFVEVGHNGSLYSLNFDRILAQSGNFKLATRFGLGVNSNVFSGDIDPAISLETDALWGKNNHYFETGLGVLTGIGFEQTVASTISQSENGTKVVKYTPEKEYNTLSLLGRVGYRYQNPNGGLFFRASVTPLATVYSKTGKTGIDLAGAIGLGYTLKQKTKAVPAVTFE